MEITIEELLKIIKAVRSAPQPIQYVPYTHPIDTTPYPVYPFWSTPCTTNGTSDES